MKDELDSFDYEDPDDEWSDNWEDWASNWDKVIQLDDINFENETFGSIREEHLVSVKQKRNSSLSFGATQEELTGTVNSELSLESILAADMGKYKTNPKYCAVLARALSDGAQRIRVDSHLQRIINRIPLVILNTAAVNVVSSCNGDFSFVRSLLNEEEDEHPYGEVLSKRLVNWIDKPEYNLLEKWLLLGSQSFLRVVLSDKKLDDRNLEILRAQILGGEGSEQLARKYGLTCSRVWQIVKESRTIVRKHMLRWRIAELVCLRYDDRGIVKVVDLRREFGEEWWIIYDFLKTNSFQQIQYISESDTFWLCSKEEAEELKSLILKLPLSFPVCNLGELLSFPCIKELHLDAINKQYVQMGEYYYNRQVIVEHICEDILQEFFPEGLNIYKADELLWFRTMAVERYGVVNMPASDRELRKKIAEISVMCDRGKYKPRQDRYISDELLEKLKVYIACWGSSCTYKKLFERFEKDLKKQGVFNCYYLQGILDETFYSKRLLEEKGHDYESTSITVSERTIKEISLNYLTDSDFDFFELEIVFLKRIINKCVIDRKIVDCHELYDKVVCSSRNLLERNNIMHPLAFYSLMEYLFANDYRFDYPYITRKQTSMKTVRVAAAVICDSMKDKTTIFCTARGYGDYKGQWEFPGGKIEEGETPQEALFREIKEELSVEIAVGDLITTVEYDYPDFHLSMDCFWAQVITGKIILKEAEAARWLGRNELDEVAWLPADRILLDAIREKWN